jgi:RNA polymerase sigma-70 factor, ECF subfamily
MVEKKKGPEPPPNRLDQGVLAAIFDLYSRSIFRYALRLCEDPLEADQIVGDVFALFQKQVSRGGGPRTELRTYVYKIAYRIFMDHARERQRTVPTGTAELNRRRDSLDSLGEKQTLLEELGSAIQKNLTEKQKHVIILRYQEGLGLREIADIMGKDINAIKSLQKRGLSKLQKSLVDKP